MAKRRLCFYFGFVARHYLRDFPAILLSLPVQQMSPSDVKHGIRVVDPTPQTRAQFLSIVGEALDLIATSDPLRFTRVRRQVRTIVNIPGLIGSAYQPTFKVCTLSLRSSGYQRDTTGAVKFLAATFVHDATCGFLVRQGTFRTSRNYDRFDRLCCREAQRFMQRLGMAKTPWDPEHLSRLGLKGALTVGLKDLAAAERHAGTEPRETSGPV